MRRRGGTGEPCVRKCSASSLMREGGSTRHAAHLMHWPNILNEIPIGGLKLAQICGPTRCISRSRGGRGAPALVRELGARRHEEDLVLRAEQLRAVAILSGIL